MKGRFYNYIFIVENYKTQGMIDEVLVSDSAREPVKNQAAYDSELQVTLANRTGLLLPMEQRRKVGFLEEYPVFRRVPNNLVIVVSRQIRTHYLA